MAFPEMSVSAATNNKTLIKNFIPVLLNYLNTTAFIKDGFQKITKRLFWSKNKWYLFI